MSDFESQLGGWLNKVGGLVNLTVEEREEITGKGAEELKDSLAATTRSNHYNASRRQGKMKHLADSFEIGRLDGEKENGNTAVGFSKSDANHARIARFLNDGTVKMKGDSFLDKGVIAAQEKTGNAIQKALTEVQQRKSK
ncbi:HK97 gp10 family phage protein [Fructobacillus sp. CRL 2054]|uniref:HK97 gp10 family phage protein n=1 Tax=Fructobacillus sp. CRL 2054 TaxID=2763007 RepID=UPI00237942C6|nr:HK97 gp10 family phage protein [Fructobacillus sp. CRL 2054]MDD9139140.1 HK97 gp10 family phage protein [Fructobacillus sp. CRL 2054]